MLIGLILLLLLIGSAVVGTIYSNFLVFYSNFFESENYHKAYYTSISALERGELVTKQRQPGYIGSGGFDIYGNEKGSFPNGSDRSLSGFSYLGNTGNETSVFRTINSRTSKIPEEGKGDVETMLTYIDPTNPESPNNSNNFNMMNYENAEVFLLYYDNSTGNPYQKADSSNIRTSNLAEIKGEIRLPKLLYNQGFGLLNTNQSLVGNQGSLPGDDALVDRQIRGIYNNSPFTVYSTQTIEQDRHNQPIVKYQYDSVIRESDINIDISNGRKGLTFIFGRSNGRTPINAHGPAHSSFSYLGDVTIISQYANNIRSYADSDRFKRIFLNTTKPQLRFSLLNRVEGYTGVDKTNTYPFLEYSLDTRGPEISDKYYTINGEGKFKDYQVNTIIQKPTVKESILGSFTSIF